MSKTKDKKVQKIKCVRIDLETWKRLMIYKSDNGGMPFNACISDMLSDMGY